MCTSAVLSPYAQVINSPDFSGIFPPFNNSLFFSLGHGIWWRASAPQGLRVRRHRTERRKITTHQLEILNATNEVGSVGPATLNVHTICR